MVTVKDFEHFLDRDVPIGEDTEPLLGKALFNLNGEQLTACTVLLLQTLQIQNFIQNTVAYLASDHN